MAQRDETLAGRHALVTGGGRGIGAAIARMCVEEGARVTVIGRDAATLSRFAAEAPDRVHAEVADIADEAQVAAAISAARARVRPITPCFAAQ